MRNEVPYITTAGLTGYLDADKIIAIEPSPTNQFTNVIFEGGYEMAISGMLTNIIAPVRLAITGGPQAASKSPVRTSPGGPGGEPIGPPGGMR